MATPVVRDGTAKWQRNAQNAQQDYQNGVSNPRASWSQQTVAASQNWAQGVQAAVTNGTFAKGVKAAGDQTWQQNTLSKGPSRYAEGVANGATAYANGFAPYAAVIKSVNLPARGPAGSATNYQRSQAIGQALNAYKVAKQKQGS